MEGRGPDPRPFEPHGNGPAPPGPPFRTGGAVLSARHLLRLGRLDAAPARRKRSEEHTSELQSQSNLVCRLLLEKKKKEETSATRHRTDICRSVVPIPDRAHDRL